MNTASPQWFGNLVTMQWWNDLWLNEGFAKFMEFVSTNITYPELQVVRLSGFYLYIINIQGTEAHTVVKHGKWATILNTGCQSCIWLFIQPDQTFRVRGNIQDYKAPDLLQS